MGFSSPRISIQTDELDTATRTELWNIAHRVRTRMYELNYGHRVVSEMMAAFWAWHLKRAADEQPSEEAVFRQMKSIILEREWFEALDCIEEFGNYLHQYSNQYTRSIPEAFDAALNQMFEQYLVGYRLIERQIVPLSDDMSAAAVREALGASSRLIGARNHLVRATELLSDRQKPDYPNTIKEAISAVESVVATVTGEGSLGAGLKKLKAAGVELHPALESAWSKMYGWTSDAEGIRHAAISEADSDQSLAKYMLVACSAFVSYVIESGRKNALI